MNRRTVFLLILHIIALILVGGFTFSSQQPAQAATLNDFTNLQWTDLGTSALFPMGAGVSEAQSIKLNNKLYVFGGYAPCGTPCVPTRRAYVFNPATPQQYWTRLADMSKGLTHGGFTTDGTDIYYAGGYPENADQTAQTFGTVEVWRYNVATDNYTALPPLPKKNSTGHMTYLDGKLHYLGGTTRGVSTPIEDVPDHYVFDLDAYATNPNTEWDDITDVAPLPNPRQHAAIAAVDGMIYYIGGQKGHDGDLVPQNDVHRYDPEDGVNGTWTQMADMPDALGRNHVGNSTVVLGGRIIVMAGQTQGYTSSPQSSVFAFDPVNNGWTTLTSLPMAQHSGVGAAINGVLYFGMGDKNNGASDRRAVRKGVPILEDATATATATPVQPTSTPSENATATSTSDTAATETPSIGQTSTPDGNTTATATSSGGQTSTPGGNMTATATLTNGQTSTPDGNTTATATLANGATSTPDGSATANATSTPDTSVTETPISGVELLIDGSFEVDSENDKLPDAWKVKVLTFDKLKCNKGIKIIAHDGECAFQFKGGVGENASLYQNITTGGFALNDTLTLSGYVKAGTAVVGKLQATVKYSDGTARTKITIPLTPSSDYQFIIDSEMLASGNVAKIKVQIRHNSPSGKMRVDAVSLKQETGASLLPLPSN